MVTFPIAFNLKFSESYRSLKKSSSLLQKIEELGYSVEQHILVFMDTLCDILKASNAM